VIFGNQLLPKVLDGSKTVTRRPVKYERIQPFGGFTELEEVARVCKYKVSIAYAVQPVIESGPGKGRGGKAVAHIRIKHVLRRPLGHYLLTAECNREGFTHFTAFRDYWTALYGSYDPTQLVDRIEFELVPDTGSAA
jgi:hypothetical protein